MPSCLGLSAMSICLKFALEIKKWGKALLIESAGAESQQNACGRNVNVFVHYPQHIFDFWGDQKLFNETFGKAALKHPLNYTSNNVWVQIVALQPASERSATVDRCFSRSPLWFLLIFKDGSPEASEWDDLNWMYEESNKLVIIQ